MRRPAVTRSPPSSSLAADRRIHFFESPPEALLFAALRRHLPSSAEVLPQHPVGDFRVDLAVVLGPRRLAVEVDGRAYHSTPAQKRADAARQRYLELVGWKVERAWAAEVVRDADQVARRIASVFRSLPRSPR